jgi:hypothetical protein
MPVDLKLRAEQFWGYLTLILGCLLSIVQFFALISPRRLDLRVFFLLVMLAAYLIRIGTTIDPPYSPKGSRTPGSYLR